MGEHHVTFDYKNYRDDKDKQIRLGGPEFLRRFLLHVLPQGFMRIRHYGFLSNRSRKQKLAIIRQNLRGQSRMALRLIAVRLQKGTMGY